MLKMHCLISEITGNYLLALRFYSNNEQNKIYFTRTQKSLQRDGETE